MRYSKKDKIVIFLDIDGVLTPIPVDGKNRVWLERLDIFETAIRPYWRSIEIVIASSWRDLIDVEDIRSAMSSPRMAKVIVGRTGEQRSNRLEEIEEWLRDHGQRDWLAVDDDAAPFSGCESHLIEVDGRKGFTDENSRDLQDRLKRLILERAMRNMTPERMGEAAVTAVSTERRNRQMLKNDKVLQDQLAMIEQIERDRTALTLQAFERIEALAPELAELAVASFDSDEIAAAWFFERISAKNPNSPLERLLRGDYEIVEIMLRQMKWDMTS